MCIKPCHWDAFAHSCTTPAARVVPILAQHMFDVLKVCWSLPNMHSTYCGTWSAIASEASPESPSAGGNVFDRGVVIDKCIYL